MNHVLRCRDSQCLDPELLRNTVGLLLDDKLDVIIMRQAFPEEMLASAAAHFDEKDFTHDWNRPNRPVPVIDLRLLGTGAAPTATTPGGPDLETYLRAAGETPKAIRMLFGNSGDPFATLESRFFQLSGLPAEVPRCPDHRQFSPCTVRALPEGTGLMVHHDNHYHLPVYDGVRDQLDLSLLMSFFVVLERADAGGRLCIYTKGPQHDAELPFLESGLPDPVAFNEKVPHQFFDLEAGDMIVFASSRLYHTVERVGQGRPRVTMGGFMGVSADHQSCMYWS